MQSTVCKWALSSLIVGASTCAFAQTVKTALSGSHAGEYCANEGGKLKPGSRTEDFARLVEGRAVHLSLSGRTMEFDAAGKCMAGC